MSQGQKSRSKCQKLRITSSVIVTATLGNFQTVVFELHATAFYCRDLDLDPMTLKMDQDIDIYQAVSPRWKWSYYVKPFKSYSLNKNGNNSQGQS